MPALAAEEPACLAGRQGRPAATPAASSPVRDREDLRRVQRDFRWFCERFMTSAPNAGKVIGGDARPPDFRRGGAYYRFLEAASGSFQTVNVPTDPVFVER